MSVVRAHACREAWLAADSFDGYSTVAWSPTAASAYVDLRERINDVPRPLRGARRFVPTRARTQQEAREEAWLDRWVYEVPVGGL